MGLPQFAALIDPNESPTGCYVLSMVGGTTRLPPIRGLNLLSYLTTTDLDGHGAWKVVGPTPTGFLLTREVEDVETQAVLRFLGPNDSIVYSIYRTGEASEVVGSAPHDSARDPGWVALERAMAHMEKLGWMFTSGLDYAKTPPPCVTFWRPRPKA